MSLPGSDVPPTMISMDPYWDPDYYVSKLAPSLLSLSSNSLSSPYQYFVGSDPHVVAAVPPPPPWDDASASGGHEASLASDSHPPPPPPPPPAPPSMILSNFQVIGNRWFQEGISAGTGNFDWDGIEDFEKTTELLVRPLVVDLTKVSAEQVASLPWPISVFDADLRQQWEHDFAHVWKAALPEGVAKAVDTQSLCSVLMDRLETEAAQLSRDTERCLRVRAEVCHDDSVPETGTVDRTISLSYSTQPLGDDPGQEAPPIHLYELHLRKENDTPWTLVSSGHKVVAGAISAAESRFELLEVYD